MGLVFKVLAILIFALGGVWGTLICLKIVTDALGFIGGVIAFFLFPITVVFAPFYAGLAHENWFPLILVYGTGISGSVLYGLGLKISGNK